MFEHWWWHTYFPSAARDAVGPLTPEAVVILPQIEAVANEIRQAQQRG